MSPFDLAFIALLALLVLRGAWRGFLVEWAGFAGLVLGYWVAEIYQGLVIPHLIEGLDMAPVAAGYLSFALIMVATYIVVVLIAKLITKIAKWVMLGWLNRLLGAVSGVAKALILSTLIIAICTLLYENGLLSWWDPSAINSSPYLSWPAAWAQDLIQFWSSGVEAPEVITA